MSFHSPVELQLRVGPTVTVPAVGSFDRFTGQARYQVTGDQVRGSFIVIPEMTPGQDACAVRVVYGDHPAQPGDERVDEPRIRRTRVRGECGPLTVDALPGIPRLDVRGQWVRADGTLAPVPRRTAWSLAEIVRAVAAHWATRPNREGLVRAAARHASQQPDMPGQAARQAAERELESIRAQIAEHWAVLQRLEEVAQAPAPRLPVLPRVVRVDFLDSATGQTRILTARPTLNAHTGTITYSVGAGARLHGDFVVGPVRFTQDALPGGVSVQLGSAPLPDGGRDNEPVVNGLRLRGSWNCTNAQTLTHARPALVPGIHRADDPRQPLSDSAVGRISSVIQALAIAYRDHSDVDALRLAAAKSRLGQLRQAPAQAVAELRQQEATALNRLNASLEAEAAFASLSA
ncbi:hypothetical protein SMD44_p10045 (plasmid) [Streptomyces alboflavus]|uniref:Uncharacterized protein n=1 Tax=Streptomyces alboflavus TaxID=67267 RepID=A0A291W3G8_9ACTN|nr:hypothetical protein [Streptomyces alboflavus]ATM24544.1 hypothetical protein SMD44_p10045 [Streptomyces alboflavus]